MKKWQTILVGAGSILCLAACSAQKQESQMNTGNKTEQVAMSHAEQGKPAPDFSLTAVDGKTYKLSDFKGKKVYLKFWASWCSICLASLPDTNDLAKEEGEDYVVLTVVSPDHQGEKSEADFKKWYEGLDYKDFPVLLDPSGKLLENYSIRSYPTQAFIDSKGNLAKTQVGFMEKDAVLETLKSLE